jgi:hypothetical protein
MDCAASRKRHPQSVRYLHPYVIEPSPFVYDIAQPLLVLFAAALGKDFHRHGAQKRKVMRHDRIEMFVWHARRFGDVMA